MAVYTPLSEVVPTQEQSYRVRVRVLRVWHLDFSKGDRYAPNDTWELLLLDEWGNRIQASVRSEFWPKYASLLEEGSCCVLLNFGVGRAFGQHKAAACPYKITFSAITVVRACDDIPNTNNLFAFNNFRSILCGLLDEAVLIDCIGQVTSAGAPKMVSAKGVPVLRLLLQLRDLEGSVIDCTLWGSMAKAVSAFLQLRMEGPVVLICQLFKINNWNGHISIRSGQFASKVCTDQELPQIKEFIHSLLQSQESVAHCITQLAYGNSSAHSSAFWEAHPMKTIRQMQLLSEPMTCCNVSTVKEILIDDGWYYLGCNKCNKKVDVVANEDTDPPTTKGFFCGSCATAANVATPRFKIEIVVEDGTGVAHFLLFDRDVSHLLNRTALELREEQVQKPHKKREAPLCLYTLVERRCMFKASVQRFNIHATRSVYRISQTTDDAGLIQSVLNGLPNAEQGISDPSTAHSPSPSALLGSNFKGSPASQGSICSSSPLKDTETSSAKRRLDYVAGEPSQLSPLSKNKNVRAAEFGSMEKEDA